MPTMTPRISKSLGLIPKFRRLRLLWLSPFLPWPLTFGGSIRVFHLMRRAAQFHEVHLAALGGSDEAAVALREFCSSVRVFKPEHTYRSAQVSSLFSGRSQFQTGHQSADLNAWLQAEGASFDAVVCEFTQMAWAPLPPGPMRVLDLHNIEHEVLRRTAESDRHLLRRWFRAQDARKLAREERDVAGRFELIAAPSEREVSILRQWGTPGEIVPVPNGVDCAAFGAPLSAAEEQTPVADVVFVGSMNYYPNEEAVRYFRDAIWPRVIEKRPGTTFMAVGGNPPADLLRLSAPGFDVVGGVPSVKPYFRKAKALAVPILSGGGTRLKILEAAASGTPIVTTSLGCEGIDVKHGQHCLIADDPQAFANALVEALDNPVPAAHRATQARELVRARYDWNAIGKQFLDALEGVLVK